MGLGEMKVSMQRDKLLDILRKNHGAHIKAHQEAVDGWMGEVAQACESILTTVAEGKLKDLDSILRHSQRPKSHAKEYELIIAMVEYHSGDTVELSQADFDCYVRDNWEWKDAWTVSNSGYRGAR